MSKTKPKRVRRSPEEARALILDAAKKVFNEDGPHQVQLKSVAAVAGVSHALVTHYFGTIDALVEEVMQAHMGALRDTILTELQVQPVDPNAILELVFRTLADPTQGRLMAWVLLSGRTDSKEFFARNTLGLRQIVDVIIGTGRATEARRHELENRLVMWWCAAVGYGAGASVLWDSMGVEHSPARDTEFMALLSECLELRED